MKQKVDIDDDCISVVGLCLIATAFITLVVDGTKSIAASALVFTPLGAGWFSLHAPSLNVFQAVVERYTFPFLWDPIILTVLLLPVWLVYSGIWIVIFVHRPSALTGDNCCETRSAIK